MPFWDDLEHHGGAIAFVEPEGRTVTYRELAESADRLNIVPGRLLLLELDNSIAAMVAYLGALRRGAPAIILNAGDETAAARMIATFRPAARWSPGAGLTALGEESPLCHPDLKLMLSTSGTTGATKLVRLSAGAIEANARSIVEYLDIDENERAITTLPPGYSYGLSVINSHLAAGASVILSEASVIDTAFRAAIEAHGATSLAGVPYTYEMLERAGFLQDMPASIRTMTQAGGKLAAERVREIGAAAESTGRRFFVMYGQTEATARMAYLPPSLLAGHADCIGRAVPGGHFDLVDPDSGVPAQEQGELIYSGPNVMMGYAETASELALGASVARLATGDLAERAGDGLFRITGRKSRFLKLFGLRLSLEQVERDAAARGWTVIATGTDQQLVLASEDADADAARLFLAESYALPPAAILFLHLPTMPRLPSGKLDYQGIIEAARRRTAEDAGPSADSGALRAFYQALSPREAITDDASFASLGGDSMSYVQATILIGDMLGALPADWQTLSVSEIERRDTGRGAEGRGGLRAVEGEMLARTFAIAAIAASHAWFPNKLFGFGLAGGSSILLVIFGLNLFRFRSATLLSQHPFKIVPSIFFRYILPYYLVILIFSAKEGFHWYVFALLGVFHNGPPGALHMYWFFEALFHLTVIVAAIFAIPPVRNAMRAQPIFTIFGLLVAAIVLRVLVELARPAFAIPPRTPDAFLYLAIGGIALAVARKKAVAVVIAAMLVATVSWGAGFDSSWGPILAIGLALLIFLPQVRLPAPIAFVVREVAQSTIYIYLGSRFVVALFVSGLHNRFPLLEFLTTFGLGIAIGHVARYIEAKLQRRAADRRVAI